MITREIPQTHVFWGRICLCVVSSMCQPLGRTPQWARDQLLDQIDNWSSTPAALEGPLLLQHPRAPCNDMGKGATERRAPRPESQEGNSGNKIPVNYVVVHSVIAGSSSGDPLLPPQTHVGDASSSSGRPNEPPQTSLATLPLAQTPPPVTPLPYAQLPPGATLPPRMPHYAPSDEDYMVMQFDDEWQQLRPFCILCRKYWTWFESEDAGILGSHRASTKHRRRMEDPEWYMANSGS